MAFLEQRGNRFRVSFRHCGQRYIHTLNTTDESIAQGFKGGIEKTLMLLDQKVLKVPEGVEVLSFIVSNGQVEQPPAQPTEAANGTPPKDITLRELKDHYIQTHSARAMEKNSLDTVAIHLRHFIKNRGYDHYDRDLPRTGKVGGCLPEAGRFFHRALAEQFAEQGILLSTGYSESPEPVRPQPEWWALDPGAEPRSSGTSRPPRPRRSPAGPPCRTPRRGRGVGELLKPKEERYRFHHNYEIKHPGAWEVTAGPTALV